MQSQIKFNLVGKEQALILVPAFANGQGPFDFVLDTGAGTTILRSELAELLGIQAGETKEALGAGGKVKVFLSQIQSLALSSAQQENLSLAVTDLTELSTAINTKVDGIVGYNFLKYFCIEIDYESRTLTFFREKILSTPSTGDIKFTLAHESKPLILVSTFVNDQGPYQFAVDTGASSTVIATELAQQMSLQTVEAEALTGAGGKIEASSGQLESLRLGETTLHQVRVAVSSFLANLSAVIGSPLDGVIGYNFYESFASRSITRVRS